MRVRKIISITAAIAMLLMLCAGAEENIAIRVGDAAYSAETITREVEATRQALEAAGQIVDADTMQEAIDEITQSYVTRGIAEMMLRDAGKWEIDENTEYSLRETAQQQYDSYWKNFRDTDELSSLDDAGITRYMSDSGITLDLIYEEIVRNYRFATLLSLNGMEVNLTDADVDAYYEESIVAPYRERYEHDIPLFEDEILYVENSNTVYAPEGYRQLLYTSFRIPDDIRAELDECVQSAQACLTTAGEAYQAIAAMAMEGEDISEQTEIYHAAMDEYDRKEVEYAAIRERILPTLSEQTDEIYSRILSGESFEDIIGGAGVSDVILYHPDSDKWPQAVREAVNELSGVGDISKPALTEDGVYIFYYFGDMPGGTIPLSEEARPTIRTLAEEACFNRLLDELTQAHRDDYGIEIDLSGIGYGQ